MHKSKRLWASLERLAEHADKLFEKKYQSYMLDERREYDRLRDLCIQRMHVLRERLEEQGKRMWKARKRLVVAVAYLAETDSETVSRRAAHQLRKLNETYCHVWRYLGYV